MQNDPRWHGWATPDQVRKMIVEMFKFLKDNNEPYAYIIVEHYCENHPYRKATSVNTLICPAEYYCEECWEKRNASV